MRMIDLTGVKFGRLTVTGRGHNGKSQGASWDCVCECGSRLSGVRSGNLRSGHTKSCGCLRVDNGKKVGRLAETHGMSGMTGNSHYTRWANIKKRTGSPNATGYSNYGGRGIKMCQEWLDSFVAFKNWVDDNLGPCPDGHSLDRIDNDGNYEPGNLRWASAKTQNNNRR